MAEASSPREYDPITIAPEVTVVAAYEPDPHVGRPSSRRRSSAMTHRDFVRRWLYNVVQEVSPCHPSRSASIKKRRKPP